jgi:diguanylate cyclase (GGDEF)-like protein
VDKESQEMNQQREADLREIEKGLQSLDRTSLALRFSPKLESRFTREHQQLSASHELRVSILATVLLNAFLISDYTEHPAHLWRSVLYRTGIFTPWAILVMVVMYGYCWTRFREAISSATIVIAGSCVLGATAASTASDVVQAQFGLMVVFVFGVLTLGMRFPYAVAAAGIVFIEAQIYMAWNPWLPGGDRLTVDLLVATLMTLTLITRYQLDRGHRLAYLLRLREQLRGESLATLNRDLAALSAADGLTGLANRRRFDDYFKAVCAKASEEGFPVSLIMIDIDRFKQLNDTFGHLFGDHVLIVLAGLFGASVRAEEDLAARYGGEEFVIVLPRRDTEQAMQVAERLCREVRGTPIVTLHGERTVFATVSCGIATGCLAGAPSGNALIALADAALYRAKNAGRDRAVAAPSV